MENHRVIANLLSREQFFTFESDLHSGLCDITLHVDEIVLDISKYIKQIILKTNTFDEKVILPLYISSTIGPKCRGIRVILLI